MTHTKTSDHGPLHEGIVKLKDLSVGYRMIGEGPPIIMITGFGSTMELWEKQLIIMLAQQYKLILFDNRGTGRTEEGNEGFSLELFADDTARLMNALGLEKAHVLGWSMGGLIAQELALKYPEKIDRLILYAAHSEPVLHPPTSDVIKQICDGIDSIDYQDGLRFICLLFPDEWVKDNKAKIREIFPSQLGTITIPILRKQAKAIEEWEGTADRLQEINSPTLLIHGDSDILTPQEHSRFMAHRIPNARLEIFQGGGHGLMFQEPEKLAEVVLNFLDE